MANINDVAREAGVSRGTVSNYLNNKKVREDYRIKIENAINKLHYVRNTAAVELRSNVSSYVVLVIPTVWTPFFSELTYWIQDELKQKGYKMILCISNSQYEQERDYVNMAEEQRAAGIISISYSQLTKQIRLGIPLVSIEKEDTGLFPLVSSDNYSIGSLAAEELAKRNVKKYIFIGSDHFASNAMKARYSGFIDYCNNNRLDYTAYKIPSSKHYDEFQKTLKQTLKEIVEGYKPGETGIFAYTDEVSVEILRVLNSFGIRVPEEIQLIGVDGWKFTSNVNSEISSIRQPVKEIARHTVEELDKQIKGIVLNEVPRILLPVTFYEGKTTKKLS